MRTQDSFESFLGVSVFAHIALVIVFSVKTHFFPTATIVIPSAIRVDIVGLPDKPTTPAASAVPEKSAASRPPTPVKTPPKKNEAVDLTQKKAFDRIKQLEALEKIKTEVKTESVQRNAVDALKTNLPVFKGNQITSGNSFTGISGVVAQEYWDLVKQHLQTYWLLPEWLSKANLKASVVVMIDQNGRVQKSEIYKSSNNPSFDEAALTAVEAASPFPVPPERIRATIGSNWMIFNFPDSM
jgi:colicin import membrane protein